MSGFWEGTGGALVGALLSGVVAVLAVVWTRRDGRALAREQVSLTAAYEVLGVVSEIRGRLEPFIHRHRPDAVIDWNAAAEFAASAEADGERLSTFASVIRPMRIEEQLALLWEDLSNVHERWSPEVLAARDRDAIDEVARDIGQSLTNVAGDLSQYLRADLERQAIADLPWWRRYRLSKRPPFVRKERFSELHERDEYGLPKADY